MPHNEGLRELHLLSLPGSRVRGGLSRGSVPARLGVHQLLKRATNGGEKRRAGAAADRCPAAGRGGPAAGLEAGADPAAPRSPPGAGGCLVPALSRLGPSSVLARSQLCPGLVPALSWLGPGSVPAGAALPPSLSPQHGERRWKSSRAVGLDVSLR